jgi:NAD(P)-dependent dehydrogenase (short-subunit alcohol dehydrogenase family)
VKSIIFLHRRANYRLRNSNDIHDEMNKINLENRHAIITGGAQGIGFSVAKRFLLSGASVTVWDRDRGLLASALKELENRGSVDSAIVDVTDSEAVSSATASTAEKFGRTDILVANAGITGPNFTCWEYPVSAWKQVIDVDFNWRFFMLSRYHPFHPSTELWPHHQRFVLCRQRRKSKRLCL